MLRLPILVPLGYVNKFTWKTMSFYDEILNITISNFCIIATILMCILTELGLHMIDEKKLLHNQVCLKINES